MKWLQGRDWLAPKESLKAASKVQGGFIAGRKVKIQCREIIVGRKVKIKCRESCVR